MSRTFHKPHARGQANRLVILLGDQLDRDAAVLQHLDRDADIVVLLETAQEATHVASHRQRTVLFLAAMRHFALELSERGYRVHYGRLDDADNTQSFETEIVRLARHFKAKSLLVTRPGEWRVLHALEAAAASATLPLEIVEDAHFYATPAEFSDWATGRRRLVLEYFYRDMRRKHGILIDAAGRPEGGQWNYDKDNRAAYRRSDAPPAPRSFRPDAITREVIDLVAGHFPQAPGRLEQFRWPVTRREALLALSDFIDARLAGFGTYQDAMVSGQRWMFHAQLSPAINLKLLNPRECVDKALAAYAAGAAPLNAVEGFVRQLLGWREFIRGVYWHEGPDYGTRNGLDQHGALPDFYWTGDTEAACLRDSINGVLDYGYGHHIERLMVTGNFALISGVHPRAISDWYLGMYVDAVDWVTLPNTLGMAMHADGGVVGTKPYAAGGQYIKRMSNHCRSCRYDPGQRSGPDACPFTVFYWDFLRRNRQRFANNSRMKLMLRNLDRFSRSELVQLTKDGQRLRAELGVGALEHAGNGK